MKLNVKQIDQDAKVAIRNLDRLVESASLLVVAVFSYLVVAGKVNANSMSSFAQDVVIGACVIIGLRGAYEFLRYLANKEA